MKLQQINEVKDSGEKTSWVMVIKFEVEGNTSVFGPFNSAGEGKNWWRRQVEEHQLNLDDTSYEFVKVTSP